MFGGGFYPLKLLSSCTPVLPPTTYYPTFGYRELKKGAHLVGKDPRIATLIDLGPRVWIPDHVSQRVWILCEKP